jgi:hypothetical protein
MQALFGKQRQPWRKTFRLNPNSRGVGCGPRSKDGPWTKINKLSPNRETREPSDCREPVSINQTVEGGGDAFSVRQLYVQKFSTTLRNHKPKLQLKRSIVIVPLNLCVNVQCCRRRWYSSHWQGVLSRSIVWGIGAPNFWTPSEGKKHLHLNKNWKIHRIINLRPSNGRRWGRHSPF